MNSDHKNYATNMEELEDMGEPQNDEKPCDYEELKKRIEALEKVNNTLADQNVKLKDQILLSRVPVQRHGLGEVGDMTRELGRLGIQETGENFVKNFRAKEKEVDLLNAKCKRLEKEKQNLLDENKKLTKELEHHKTLNAKSKKVAMHNIKLQKDNDELLLKVQQYRDIPKDYKDGASKSEEKTFSYQMKHSDFADFRHPFNCPVSCVPSVVSYIFHKMELRVCNRRFILEMHCLLRELPDEVCKVGNCSLSFQDFHYVGLFEETPLFVKDISEYDEVDGYLQEAIEIMKNEFHPALFVIKYKEGQDGTTRAGHCMAILPNGIIWDVQMERVWEPKSDKLLKSVNEIALWKVVEKEAKEWEEKCGLRKCKTECTACTSDNRSTCYDELS